MASGGARGNAGRRPDPDALRRDRPSDSSTWTTLVPIENPSEPSWPLSSQSDREAVVWSRLWARPQASEWSRMCLEDEVALYTRYLVEAEEPEASASVRTLVKQHQELLGLSTAGLLRLRWRFGGATEEDSAPARSSRPSARERRLSSVPNVGA